VDLFFISRREPIEPLLEQAAQKDPGFDWYWFAVALNRCENFPDELERWPVKMLKVFEPSVLKNVIRRLLYNWARKSETGQSKTPMMPQTALKYDVEVKEDGRVELTVPFPPGAHVIVFVIEAADDIFADLLLAAQSSLDFWDNAFDDEDWNNA
jgi:hypothetical protein